jgi:hypothetical protein
MATVVSPTASPRESSNDLCYMESSEYGCWTTMEEDDDEVLMMVESPLSATSHQEASKVLEEWQSDDSVVEVVPPSPCTGTIFDLSSVAAVSDNDEDDEDIPEDIATLMEVDEEIGSNFLNEEVFGGVGPPSVFVPTYCISPTGPLEEVNGYYYGNGCKDSPFIVEEDDDRLLAPLLDEEDHEAVVMALDSVLVEVITFQNINFDPNAPFDEERYKKVHETLAESMKKTQETRKCLSMKTAKTEKYSRSKTVSGVISSIEKSSRQVEKYLQSVQKAVG